MSPDVLAWLSKTGGAVGIFILALWLFRDRIYFSFGQPPAGIRFRHPADSIGADDSSKEIAPPRPRKTRRRIR